MNSLISFDYNGVTIPFELTENDVMINATLMAKACGKKIGHYLSNQSTKELISEISSVIGIPITELVIIVQGGTPQNQGTWFHRLIAIHFAMWCNPIFGVWCLQKLDEIIQNGYAFRDAEIQRLSQENNNLQEMIQSMQPQVDYYNSVLTYSGLSYSTEQICKELNLGCSSKTLLNKLEEFGYIYRRQDGKWFLSAGYDNCGYIIVTTKVVISSKTRKKYSKPVKRWTEEGKHFIWSLKKKLGFY